MNKTKNRDLELSIVKMADHIQERELPWVSGIYPSEMAFFLGVCEAENIDLIIESGRGPDAYSTNCIGHYVDKHDNIRAVSIDFAPIRTKHYGRNLASYSSLNCLHGDSIKRIPDMMRSVKGRVAFLIDGPKNELAIDLGLGILSHYHPAVIAFHNMPLNEWNHDECNRRGMELFHYEALSLESYPEWNKFREFEARLTDSHVNNQRSLAQSSLALARPEYLQQNLRMTIRANAMASYWRKCSNWVYRFLRNHKRKCMLP